MYNNTQSSHTPNVDATYPTRQYDMSECIASRLTRESERASMTHFLTMFATNSAGNTNVHVKRGMYVRGGVGAGKTKFVFQTLHRLGYNIITFDAGDLRNKSVFEAISTHNLTPDNIMSKFNRQYRPTAIVIDEMDGMNSGDSGGLTALIKIIRPKKTKKQREEQTTSIPIICIGNYFVNKKINELIKVCATLNIPSPTPNEIWDILSSAIPRLINAPDPIVSAAVSFVQGDLRKLRIAGRIFINESESLETQCRHLVALKMQTDSANHATNKLLHSGEWPFHTTSRVVNETDRTIVGYLMHENVPDILCALPPTVSRNVYIEFLDNLCYGDYMDRVAFQKQIWKLNELSAMIKIFKNARLLGEAFAANGTAMPALSEIRFTKMLTKYSTEFNNYGFLQWMCRELSWDLDDVISYFLWLSIQPDAVQQDAYTQLSECDIKILDVKRITRLLENYKTQPPSETQLDNVNGGGAIDGDCAINDSAPEKTKTKTKTQAIRKRQTRPQTQVQIQCDANNTNTNPNPKAKPNLKSKSNPACSNYADNSKRKNKNKNNTDYENEDEAEEDDYEDNCEDEASAFFYMPDPLFEY